MLISGPPRLAKRVIVPYGLWSDASTLLACDAQALSALVQWLRHAELHTQAHGPSLSMPHELAQAAALGWPVQDGLLPWAAQAAVQAGLAHPGDGSAWAWVSLCHWQISHGQATLTDPQDLALDDATDAAVWAAMQPFFAEDGLTLHRHQPGVWLVQSPTLAHLPTASLDRVIGEDIDEWLVGAQPANANASSTDTATQAGLWRRLQNEMQMLLYTHPINAQRQVPINSFWLHGSGALPAHAPAVTDTTLAPLPICQALRQAHFGGDWVAWLAAWQDLQTWLFAEASSPTELVCTSSHETRVVTRLDEALHASGRVGWAARVQKAWHALNQKWQGADAARDWRRVLAASPVSSHGPQQVNT
ncbi:MAG: hypothetical protein RLZZ24_440 [Pseudomonadota bacterium]